MKTLKFLFFILVIIPLNGISQNVYKGGEGDGYAMGYYSNYSNSITQKSIQKAFVFPNPIVKNKNSILEIKNSTDIKKVEIIDLKGIVKKTGYSSKTNVNSLPQGFYMIKIVTQNTIFWDKLLVQ